MKDLEKRARVLALECYGADDYDEAVKAATAALEQAYWKGVGDMDKHWTKGIESNLKEGSENYVDD